MVVAPDKKKNESDMSSDYQQKIAGLYYFPTSYVKKLVPKLFIKKNMCFIMKACNFTLLNPIQDGPFQGCSQMRGGGVTVPIPP